MTDLAGAQRARAGRLAVDAVVAADRRAVFAVRLVALLAVRRVVVAPRLAVLTARLLDVRADVAVPFAPALAARVVLLAPRFALRAVFLAPALADEPVARALRTVRAPVRFASRTVSIADSVTSDAPERTRVAVPRATFDPRGDTRGFCRFNTVAMTSLIAVTLPCANPLTVSPNRSATPAAAPTARLPGGASDARG